jgi:hypothetical protein
MERKDPVSFIMVSALGWEAGASVGLILMAALWYLLLQSIGPGVGESFAFLPILAVLPLALPPVVGMAAGSAIGGGITALALGRRYSLSRRSKAAIAGGWAIGGAIGGIASCVAFEICVWYIEMDLLGPAISGVLVFLIIGAVGGWFTSRTLSLEGPSSNHEQQLAIIPRRRRRLITLGWAIGGAVGGAVAVGLPIALGNQVPMDGITSIGWACFMCCILPGGPATGAPVAGAIGSAIMAWQLGWTALAQESDEAQEDAV